MKENLGQNVYVEVLPTGTIAMTTGKEEGGSGQLIYLKPETCGNFIKFLHKVAST